MTKPIKLSRKQIKEGLNQVPMDTLILGTAAKHAGERLTPKQREFARLVALGESKAQSYRKAYNSKGNSKTAADNGHKLSKHTGIQQVTEAFAQAQRFAESHTPAQLRAFVIQQLTQHASNEDFPPATRLKALELIGKHAEVGSFLDRKEVVTIKQSGDIRERILDKLKLIGASSTIEHNAAQDDEQDAESLLAELHPTHTIDAGEANDDEDIPEYGPESGFSHADGMLEATGSGSVDGIPTPTGHPLNRGVIPALDTHNIPHIQTCDLSIPHNQSSTEVNPHVQSSATHSSDVSPMSDIGPLSDDNLSVETDAGLDVLGDDELSTGLVDK